MEGITVLDPELLTLEGEQGLLCVEKRSLLTCCQHWGWLQMVALPDPSRNRHGLFSLEYSYMGSAVSPTSLENTSPLLS